MTDPMQPSLPLIYWFPSWVHVRITCGDLKSCKHLSPPVGILTLEDLGWGPDICFKKMLCRSLGKQPGR